MMAAAKQSPGHPAALALVLLMACALTGSAQASRATSMHGPWIADGRSVDFDVQVWQRPAPRLCPGPCNCLLRTSWQPHVPPQPLTVCCCHLPCLQITTGNWVEADFDGVSTPARMNNFYATPTTQWDKYWWRLETSSAVKCSRFDVTLKRLDTFASETRYFEDCQMYKDDSGCHVQYHRFFGDSVVMKWEYC